MPLDQIDQLTSTLTGMTALIAFGIAFVSLIITFILCVSLAKAIKTQKRLMNGNNQANIEQLLIEIRNKYAEVKSEQEGHGSLIKVIQAKLKTMKSKIGVHRYNAFASDGSDLSFTIALVDDEANGVLLTGIHSREQTYVYAKPVENGDSTYNLSPEEKETLIRILR